MVWLKRILAFVIVVLIVIQFIPQEQNNEGYATLAYFIEDTKPSEAVQEILKTGCYDCHSNQTQYPWYAKVAPVKFWLGHHIEEGKEHLNFSAWESYALKRKDHKLDEVIEEVEEGEMPLDSYTWVHHDAKLSPDQIELLVTWAKTARLNYAAALRPQ